MGDTTEENARLEVCLALTNKFQAPADDMTDLNKLFIKTKELCVSIIPFLNGKFSNLKLTNAFIMVILGLHIAHDLYTPTTIKKCTPNFSQNI